MIKTLLILVLSVALLAAAFFTRPSQADFSEYVTKQFGAASSGNTLERIFGKSRAEAFLDDCTFQDRYLWVEVQRDGQTIYTGAFDHWFERDALAKPVKS